MPPKKNTSFCQAVSLENNVRYRLRICRFRRVETAPRLHAWEYCQVAWGERPQCAFVHTAVVRPNTASPRVDQHVASTSCGRAVFRLPTAWATRLRAEL